MKNKLEKKKLDNVSGGGEFWDINAIKNYMRGLELGHNYGAAVLSKDEKTRLDILETVKNSSIYVKFGFRDVTNIDLR